ncbi:glycosyltransferase family 2 protein [Paenibacillus sp. BR2-3]|uniref:glycosyltransferase family 2 protein n=1 Tax=Paenibacillus sp. BR2-3 TaxID=3048494 RepID=UPI0039777F04
MIVSVIIPNYNGEKYLYECLTTLKQQTYQNFEVIMVDNASIDRSIEVAQKLIPEIKCVLLEDNKGFSAAVNQGILQSEGQYIVLLNNDTLLTKDWLQNLVCCIQNNEKVFSCASKMLQYHNNEFIDNAGDAFTIFGWAYQEGHGRSENEFTKNRPIFTACAGAAIYRREVFDKIGYFDERFFAYLEDVDIGYRARIEGYQNIYCSNSIIYHIGSATTGNGYNSIKVKLSARNNVYLLYKNMIWFQILLNAPFLLVGHLFKYYFYKRIGFEKEYLSGIKEGLKNRKLIDKKKFEPRKSVNYFKIQGWLLVKGVIYGSIKIRKMLNKIK